MSAQAAELYRTVFQGLRFFRLYGARTARAAGRQAHGTEAVPWLRNPAIARSGLGAPMGKLL